jgi:hypothetical protein
MHNAIGDELNDAQAELVKAYRTIEDVLRNRAEELAPYEARNATKALAALWQVMNGLDMDPGQLYDLGA